VIVVHIDAIDLIYSSKEQKYSLKRCTSKDEDKVGREGEYEEKNFYSKKQLNHLFEWKVCSIFAKY